MKNPTRPRPLAALLALGLATSVGAQTTYIATPVGHSLETNEGDDQLATGWHFGRSWYLGGYAAARFQYCDDELTDNKLRVIKSIGFRHDNTNFGASDGVGRAWTNVTVSISELPYANLSSTFANNLVSPVGVFNASVTWPTMTGTPPTKPAAMSAALQFPFTAPYIHTGTSAILSDFTFVGGTLAVGTWGTSQINYSLDGMACVDNMYTGAATYPNPDNGCNDPAVSATQGATMVSGYNQFSLANPTKSNTIEIPLRTRYTAPNAPVFHAFGIRGMTAGVNIGAGCNLLYLDFTLPVVVYATVAGALPNAETPQNTLIAPRTAANLAFEVWAQGAWANSNTGAFSLTRATKAVAPNLGMTDVPPRKRMVYVYNNVTQASGSMTRETYSYNHPITFYGQ